MLGLCTNSVKFGFLSASGGVHQCPIPTVKYNTNSRGDVHTDNIIHKTGDFLLLPCTICHQVKHHWVGKHVPHNLEEIKRLNDCNFQSFLGMSCRLCSPPTSSELVSPFHFHPGSEEELYQSPSTDTFSSTTERAISPRTPVTCV